MNKYKSMDANEAVSNVAYKFSELCGIYPITPASVMAENVDKLSVKKEKNFFNNTVEVIEMQSEAGAIATVHGALQSGTLASTFTASQGLLLMIPSLYKLAGEMLPGVIHVAARSLSTHALSIFGDHQDIYAVRQTGVCMLSSSTPEQAYHFAAISHLSAIKSSLPFIHFFDGFRTSHEINKIKLMDNNELYNLIDKESLIKFRNKGININNPTTRGTAQNDDVYFQNTESRNKDYIEVVEIVNDYMDKLNKINNTNYKPFNYYGSKTAKNIIIAMGSVCETIKETINYLNKDYGLIEVNLYRPFSKEYLLKEIPNTVKNITVLDRTKEFGSNEPLYLDVVSCLKDKNINIYGGRYGLSSKNTTPSQIKAIFDYMDNNKLFNNFTIGINDDVTNLSLEVDDNFKIINNNYEMLIYGFGSDGMVSTSKDILKIVGDNTPNYVQGYFQYDSKKSGGVTRSHLRIGSRPILSTYYVDNPDLIVVTKDNYLYKFDILDNIKDNGILILNTSLNNDDLLRSLPNKVKYLLAKKNVSLYTMDAYKLVNELGLKNKISTCMEICIFKIINILNLDKIKDIMKDNNERRFKSKGKEIIDINNKIVDISTDYLKELSIDKDWINIEVKEEIITDNLSMINNLKGDKLPVSAFINNKDGVFNGSTTKLEKRNTSEFVPCWIKENCIQCNKCAFVCPHAVIRPYLLDEDKEGIETLDSLFPKDKKYTLAISYENCTGCGLCANVCPGKNDEKALAMIENKDVDNAKFNYLKDNNDNKNYNAKIMNVKNIGFVEPKFEFSGACQGCGEATYLKLLTQMFNNNLTVANATGCSSIYSASYPSLAYNLPWSSSLFEDNAEYGLGIKKGVDIKRNKIKNYMLEHIDLDKELFTKWIDNIDNYDICLEVSKEIDYDKHPYLKKFKDYIVPYSTWIIGGDGFAYDIGYSGLDHVLSLNENINMLVLDTEVYSNTGGQSSKSSNLGSIASFSINGKKNYKKDLARIAMCYPNVYVACVNIGYNQEQYLKVLKEASLHNGPSLIIAYSPCIEHGIKQGMEHSLDNSYLASKCGYFLTFSYNPDTNKFTLNSKDVDFDKYMDYLKTENRFNNLLNNNKEEALEILENQKKWAIDRYNYYKNLED